MNVIDLRSDTVTLPSEAMRKAMYEAELGDDVYGEDPTVNRLQQIAAERLGKEAGLFVPTGTMGNVISMLVHVARGEEVLVGNESHIYVHEQGASSTLGGIHMKVLPNQPDGSLKLQDIEEAISSPDDEHLCRTKCIALENAFNGSVIKLDYMKEFIATAKKHGLSTHLDGARLFNACTVLKCKPTDLVAGFDSVQFCFSKGLGTPVGSMIVASKSFIKEAKRWRKALGGGMRQVGVLAAACEYALDNMVERLAEDHETARVLANKIAKTPGIKVNWDRVHSNMVWFDVEVEGVKNALEFCHLLDKEGVKVLDIGPKTIRAVTHYGISVKDAETAGDIINKVLQSCHKAKVTAR